MFGIGNGNGQETGIGEQPQDTKSIWGDMFGLGGLMKVITDPALVAHAHAMMQATIEGANSSRRIEAKLDRLLGALGHEISDINSRFPAQFQSAPALLVEHGANAAGGTAAATGAPDNGGRGAAASLGSTVVADELRGVDDPAGEPRFGIGDPSQQRGSRDA
jgi:hypothetical protein